MIEVVLPNLGFGMEEGRLIRWVRQPGDPIKKGDVLAEIESDKAAVELGATVEGTLHAILIDADTVVPVGTVLAHIQTEPLSAPADSVDSIVPSRRATPLAERYATEHAIDLELIAGTGRGGLVTRDDIVQALSVREVPAEITDGRRALAAPAVRKAARLQGIDLQTIDPTGRYGQVTHADLQNARALNSSPSSIAAPEQPPTPIPTASVNGNRREITLTPMRRAIARRVVQSMQQVPHFYVTAEFDLSNALASLPSGVGVNALLLYLTVQTLLALPTFNATFENDQLFQSDQVDLSLAVALDKGLITPTLVHADQYSISGLATQSRALIERARTGKMTADDRQSGTFTLSNLGIIQQVDHFTAILNTPQVGILAVGAVKDRPVVIGGGLHIRKTVHATLSADHRIIDGLLAGRFMEIFADRLRAFTP